MRTKQMEGMLRDAIKDMFHIKPKTETPKPPETPGEEKEDEEEEPTRKPHPLEAMMKKKK